MHKKGFQGLLLQKYSDVVFMDAIGDYQRDITKIML